MQQAEWGWAGNKGRMGRVGETTASSHQHRCRYPVIVVCYFIVLLGKMIEGTLCLLSLRSLKLQRKRRTEKKKGKEKDVSEAERTTRDKHWPKKVKAWVGGDGTYFGVGGRNFVGITDYTFKETE